MSFLSALGNLFSEGRDVRVPAGTPMAVQLEQGLVLVGRGTARAPDAFTIYTAADRVRAAQQALAQQNYYRGPINGQLDDATQRAIDSDKDAMLVTYRMDLGEGRYLPVKNVFVPLTINGRRWGNFELAYRDDEAR